MVEMMFAIMILSIVLLGLVSVLGSVLRNQFEGRNAEKVAIAANTLFAQAGHALTDHWDRPLVPDLFPAYRQDMANLEGISYELSETKERDDLKRVDIKIYWKDKNGNEHQKAMTTKILRAP
jgi:type II secretory pathway pseudopilin PulG